MSPLIPQKQSEGNIRVSGTPEMSLSAVNKSERAQAGAVNAIENVEDTFTKIRDFRQVNEASVYHSQAARDIQTLAKADSDIDLDRYASELDKKTLEASKTISGGLAREEFMAKAKQQNIVTNYEIKNLYRTQQLEGAKSIVLLKSEQLVSNFGDMTPIEQHKAVADWKTSLNQAVTMGVWNKAEGEMINLKTQEKLNESILNSDRNKDNATSIDESYVYKQLKLGKEGAYPQLTSEQRTKEIDLIERKVRRNQILFTFQKNQDQDQNERQMLVDATERKLTPEKVKDGLLSQSIRLSFGEKMLKKVYDNPNPDTDYSVYNKVRKMQLTDSTPQEINQFILDNLDKLSNSDKKFLIDKTFSEVDSKQKTIIRYNADALKSWAKEKMSLMPEVSSNLIYEFHRRVNQSNAQGQEIDVIAQELQKEKIKELYPNTALMDDVPNFTANRNKLKRVYEKESKLKGKTAPTKTTNSVAGSGGVDFDEL